MRARDDEQTQAGIHARLERVKSGAGCGQLVLENRHLRVGKVVNAEGGWIKLEATEHQCLGALIEKGKALLGGCCSGYQQSERGNCKGGGPANSHQAHISETFGALLKVGPEQLERYRLIPLNPKADFGCFSPIVGEGG